MAAIFISFIYLVVAGTRAVKPIERDGDEDNGPAEEEEKEREQASEGEPATVEDSDSTPADS